jgi:hypothetical protein
MKRQYLTLGFAAAVASTGCGGGEGQHRSAPASPAQDEATAQTVTTEADRALHEMSDYVASLDAFEVDTAGSLEVVLKDGQKLSFPFASKTRVRRPDKLRSDRKGEKTALHFYYDGQTFTLFGEKANMYAQKEAPPTIEEAIDVAREELDIEAPGADLIGNDVYAALTEDVVSGFIVGDASCDGTPCRHLAFRGNEVDWQIWIDTGAEPLPRRLIITSKKEKGSPEFAVELDWDTDVKLADNVFEFTPPEDARRIDFLPLEPRKTS